MKIYLLIAIVLASITCEAKEKIICDATQKGPCVVQDTENNAIKLKHYREATMLAKAYAGNTTGLAGLWLSGGSASSQQDWKKIFQRINNNANQKAKLIIDLDLRQESHGYLNNNAINLTTNNNWINLNKNVSQIILLEKNWLSFLNQQSSIENVLKPMQFKSKKFSAGKNIPVQTISSEKKLVEKIGFHYVRLAVTDHMAPRDSEVDHFVNLIKKINSETWLHIHCRGGDGRTTTFMAMFDMLKNADKVSFAEIIKRQAAVSPFYDLSNTERKNRKFTNLYKRRLNFLAHFYKFSQDYLHGYAGNWSAWKKENPLFPIRGLV